MYNLKLVLVVILIALNICVVNCDLPVHCKREAIDGQWTFRIEAEIFQPSLTNEKSSCGHGFPDKIETTVGDTDFSFAKYTDIKIKLASDYKVYENNLHVGNWTPVYDEGFILKYKDSVFTAFMKYYKDPAKPTEYLSNCDKTMIGWYIPDINENNKNWSCFFGKKQTSALRGFNIKTAEDTLEETLSPREQELKNVIERGTTVDDNSIIANNAELPVLDLYNFVEIKENTILQDKVNLEEMTVEEKRRVKYEDQREIVEEINGMNLGWRAHVHDEFKGLSLLELNEKLGFRRNNGSERRNVRKSTKKSFFSDSNLPHLTPLNENKILTSTFTKKPIDYETMELRFAQQAPQDGREIDSKLVKSAQEFQKYLNSEIVDIDESKLSKNWDWRDVGGASFVPRLRKQNNCGSCYVFSSVSSLEARLRVLTNNRDKTEFSRQFPLSCSFYTEGCDGGYPILVGKFFNEFEIIPEECFEYQSKNVPCDQVCDYTKYPKKYTVSKYEYIGGFYGATSEVEMMKELRARGPIPGNISVPWSFSYYSKGIYSHQKFLEKNAGKLSKSTLFDKRLTWEKVDHSILIVGWGEENGVKYWTGMNTWGENWGENGFFRILRGENECSVESMGDCFRIKVEQRQNSY